MGASPLPASLLLISLPQGLRGPRRPVEQWWHPQPQLFLQQRAPDPRGILVRDPRHTLPDGPLQSEFSAAAARGRAGPGRVRSQPAAAQPRGWGCDHVSPGAALCLRITSALTRAVAEGRRGHCLTQLVQLLPFTAGALLSD